MATQKIALTDAKLKQLKPKSNRYEIRDERTRGLRVRVGTTGRITFRWLAKAPTGKNIVKTLGSYPAMSLADARKKVESLKLQHTATLLGESIEGEEQLRTVNDLAETFYKRRIVPHRRRPEEVRSVLDTHILPAIGKRLLTTITTSTCRSLVEKVVDGGAAARAGKVLAILKQMFDFALSRGDMDSNPAAPLKAENLGVINNTRSRSLSGDEIKQFWEALDNHKRLSAQTRIAFKILTLTGVRTGEILKGKWKEVDLEAATWTIPVSNQKLSKKQEKNARPFVVPLSDQAVALFRDLKRYTGRRAYLMATDSKLGRLDDKSLGHALRRMFEAGGKDKKPRLEIKRFVTHDLRRTCRTHLGKLRVPPHIAERCLNHSLGKIVDTYDTGDYLDERREALHLWADQVDIFLGKVANVMELRA